MSSLDKKKLVELPFIEAIHNVRQEKVLYLIFSAMSTSEGRFQMHKTFSSFEGVVCFINDKDNGWYQHGIPGVEDEDGDDIDASIRYLTQLKKSQGCSKVVCVGASMGGYGAALYATLLNAEECFCFASEFVLGKDFSRSSLHCQNIKENGRKLLRAKDSMGTKFYVFCGDEDVIDVYNSALFLETGGNVQSYVVPGVGHDVTKKLHEDFGVGRLVANFRGISATPEFRMTCIGFENFITVNNAKALYNAYLLLRRRENEAAINFLEQLDQRPFLVGLFKGIVLSRMRKYDAAYLCLNKSYAMREYSRDAIFELAVVSRILGKLDVAIDLYKKVRSIDPKFSPALYHLAICYEKKNRMYLALDFIEQALELAPSKREYMKLQDKLLSKLKVN